MDCLKKVELESVALIASMTKKIKQMIFFYLTDFMLGPEHEEGITQKEYILGVFNDLIARIKRKAVYICDSDMDIGKAQFCFYFIKFSKNREVRNCVEFMEDALGKLLNFETQSTDTFGEENRFV